MQTRIKNASIKASSHLLLVIRNYLTSKNIATKNAPTNSTKAHDVSAARMINARTTRIPNPVNLLIPLQYKPAVASLQGGVCISLKNGSK